MIGTSTTRLATTMAVLVAVGAGIVATAPAAGADTLSCLAPVSAVQSDNNQAIQDDQAGNTAAAASVQAGDVSYENTARTQCYFNPKVPYGAYSDASIAFGYVDDARTANNAGNAAQALSDEQTAAGYLSQAVRILNNVGP